jgi:CelD/BcsL family acetyltransferase involved in cellulose biosynthesis
MMPFPFSAERCAYAHLARGLIFRLFRSLDFEKDAEVLVPDYHHGNEVRAIRAAGPSIDFYRIDRRLRIDLDDVRKRCTPRTRVLFVIHYLGFPQPMDEIRTFCAEQNLLLIEDCALALFSEHQGRPVGSLGDYGVFCLYKTLPVPNGALLVANAGAPAMLADEEMRPSSLPSIAGRCIELASESIFRFGRMRNAIVRSKRAIGSALSWIGVERTAVGDASFVPEHAAIAISPLSSRILRRVDFDDVRTRRRMLYTVLDERLDGSGEGLGLHLEDGVCPLFYPLLVDDKKRAVGELSQRGIGAIEFWNGGDPEANRSDASEAAFLRRHLIELPIHQDLTIEHIDYMADTVRMLGLARRPRIALPSRAQRGSPEITVTSGGSQAARAVAQAWNALCDEGPCADLFHRPEWWRAHHRAFDADQTTDYIGVRIGGALRAIAPFIEDRTKFCGLPARRLRLPANAHSYRADVVHGTGSVAEALAAMWAHLRSMPWDVLELSDVPDGGAGEMLLAFASSEGWPTGQWPSIRSPYMVLPSDPDRLLEEISAKFRSNLRRRAKKLESQGEIEFTWDGAADPGALQQFYTLERGGWKGGEGSAIACRANTRRFYDEIAGAASKRGELALCGLWCGGRPIAMQLGITSKESFHLLKTAYDEAFAECAPGQLIVERVARAAIERGLRRYEFLGASMPWKLEWTSRAVRHSYCYVFNRGWYGRLLYATKFHVTPAARAAHARLTNLMTPRASPAARFARE